MMLWPPVLVTSLFGGRLARDLAAFAPTHIVSLIDPDLEVHRRPVFPADVAVFQRNFYDHDKPGAETADAQTMHALIAYLRDWAGKPDVRLLVHCHMGVSRSTASAYTALAIFAGPGREAAAFDRLLTFTSKPWPNKLVVELADAALGRDGALVAPLLDYRRANKTLIGAYARLNRRRGLY